MGSFDNYIPKSNPKLEHPVCIEPLLRINQKQAAPLQYFSRLGEKLKIGTRTKTLVEFYQRNKPEIILLSYTPENRYDEWMKRRVNEARDEGFKEIVSVAEDMIEVAKEKINSKYKRK